MQLTVEFPSVMYREGPAGVRRLAREIERIGYDRIDLFDHVVMGHPTDTRPAGRYPATMPMMEAVATLGFLAGATETIGLGTEVLVLPQRHPVLVAKQISTLDTLSGGRMRLGVGVGWQESEYEALGESFSNRGKRMDEAIDLLRVCWSDDPITFEGEYYQVDSMAMEPKPARGVIPIWIGGASDAALERAGVRGDGWMAVGYDDLYERGADKIEKIKHHAEDAGRDPSALGFQAQISPPPRSEDPGDRTFYADADRVAATAARLVSQGFDGLAVNLTGVFLAGARSLDAMLGEAERLYERLRAEVG